MTATRMRFALVSAVLVCAIVLGQFLAAMSAPVGYAAEADRLVADTSAAYLTGLRSFAAAVLWVRIDPVMHDYYGGVPLESMTFMIPTLWAVIWLDPHLEEPAYVLPFMLAQSDRVADALKTADQSRIANPHSGLLIIGSAQIVDIYAHDTKRAADIVVTALSPSTTWRSDFEEANSLTAGRAILTQAGRLSQADRITAILKAIDAAHPGGLEQPSED